MTYRERRERRVELLRDRAEKSEGRADAAYAAEHAIGDQIPMGQPILVGHHSQRRAERDRDRMQRLASISVEESQKAERQASSAATIESQLANSIYDDDEDAVERLQEKIAGLEAERDRYKAYNASCKRGAPDPSLLDERQRANVETIAKVCPYQFGKKGEVSYSNLSANINRLKKRVEALSRPERGRRMSARFESTCDECDETIGEGDSIVYYKRTRTAVHANCDPRREVMNETLHTEPFFDSSSQEVRVVGERVYLVEAQTSLGEGAEGTYIGRRGGAVVEWDTPSGEPWRLTVPFDAIRSLYR